MVLGIAVDLSVLSYPVLVIMKEQGADVGRGGACPGTSGEAKPALRCQARRSLPSDVGRGGASPQPSGEAESSPWGSGEVELIFRRSGKKCSSVLV